MDIGDFLNGGSEIKLFSNNEFNMDVINDILKVYYLSTGISVFAINEISNVIASSKKKSGSASVPTSTK